MAEGKMEAAIAKAVRGERVSDAEAGAAIAEGAELLRRAVEALERIAGCADGIQPSAFRVIRQD